VRGLFLSSVSSLIDHFLSSHSLDKFRLSFPLPSLSRGVYNLLSELDADDTSDIRR
jgi:hypothetical protein